MEVRLLHNKIAVEDSLDNVKEFLTNKGYDVSTLKTPLLAYDDDTDYEFGDENYYDAIVISGQSQNYMGITKRLTDATIIDAAGKTPDEVYNQIKSILK